MEYTGLKTNIQLEKVKTLNIVVIIAIVIIMKTSSIMVYIFGSCPIFNMVHICETVVMSSINIILKHPGKIIFAEKLGWFNVRIN